ncbi:hypothetical protein [Mesoplasma photuris]|uniref:hypothetical protein n=1 Tax=Mesoplasma photuris TaxID=217731 RepID=UPI00146F9552|nr:hypothetical protein [Mesoplasma photuris]
MEIISYNEKMSLISQAIYQALETEIIALEIDWEEFQIKPVEQTEVFGYDYEIVVGYNDQIEYYFIFNDDYDLVFKSKNVEEIDEYFNNL